MFEYPDPDGNGIVSVFERSKYDRASQINRIQWRHRIEGKEDEVAELNLRVYFPAELKALIHYNGLEIESMFGNFDFSPFSSDSPSQIYECRPR